MDGAEKTLPRDEFTVRLRELRDNPGAVSTQSRIDIADFYGQHETWTVDTFRHDGIETAFVQRMSAEGGLRLLVPPQVMAALVRGHETLTGKNRARGARRAVETRIARGDVLGNPDALRKARAAGRKPRRKAKRR
jgi:hypothetical protein